MRRCCRLKWCVVTEYKVNTWWIRTICAPTASGVLVVPDSNSCKTVLRQTNYFWELCRLTKHIPTERRRHQRQTRWTSKPNLNSCEWCTRCSLSFDLCISMSHTESLILIDLTTQSIQLLLSFASASFLSLETEATRSNTFKINKSFKFKVTLTPSKGSAALTWGASTASLELGFVPQCDWRMICTNYETLSNSNKSWTRRPTQISSFTTFIRLTLCKFWLLQNFGTRIQNLLILYDPLWSYRLQKYYNTLAKKKNVQSISRLPTTPGSLPSAGICTPACRWRLGHGDINHNCHTKCKFTNVTPGIWLAVSFHLTKIQTWPYFIIFWVCSEQWIETSNIFPVPAGFAPFSSRKFSSSGARRTWPALFRLEELDGTRRN